MRRLVWFAAGAAASTFVMVKGREYARRLTPEGMAEQIERRVDETAVRTKGWLADFADTYGRAREAKHTELMGLLTDTERGRLE
ncbi:MAG: DUF6167 family protein [Propionibacteriaceae bacterium]|nr:DUF6167 family protein [Propionibacteriaceae bacterium]